MATSDKRLDKFIEDLKGDIDHLTNGLMGGQLTVDQWHQEMEDLLTEGHTAAYLVASGQKDVPDLVTSQLGKYIADQLDFLDDYAAELDRDGPGPSDPARARMYGNATRASWAMGETTGWPLPVYPGQDTDCLTNCKCEWNIVVIDPSAGDADAYWERHATDSCDTCVAHAGEFSPFRIRGGQPA